MTRTTAVNRSLGRPGEDGRTIVGLLCGAGGGRLGVS
jgi:hypothetical protein